MDRTGARSGETKHASRLMRDAMRHSIPIRLLAMTGSLWAVHAGSAHAAGPTLAAQLALAVLGLGATALALVAVRSRVGTHPRLLEVVVWMDLGKYVVLGAAVDPGARDGVWLLGLIAVSETAAVRGPRAALVQWAALATAIGVLAIQVRGVVGLDAARLLGWLALLSLGPSAFAANQAWLVGRALVATERARAGLRLQATTDELTGLCNRRGLLDRFVAASPAGSFRVLFLDLDGFKAINDTLGHEAGDEALRVVAQRLRGLAPPGAVVCRLAGDEFALLLLEPVDDATVTALVDDIAAVIAGPLQLRGMDARLGVSIGAAQGGPGDELLVALDAADARMYVEKQRRRTSDRPVVVTGA